MISKIIAITLIGLSIILFVAVILRLTPAWDQILSTGNFTAVNFKNLSVPKTPNWFLACPDTYCIGATASIASPRFAFSKNTLAIKIREIIKTEGNFEIQHESESDLDLIIRTPLFRWPDLVSIKFIELGNNRSTLAIYSRSIYGRSDFQTNEKRVARWLQALKDTTVRN